MLPLPPRTYVQWLDAGVDADVAAGRGSVQAGADGRRHQRVRLDAQHHRNRTRPLPPHRSPDRRRRQLANTTDRSVLGGLATRYSDGNTDYEDFTRLTRTSQGLYRRHLENTMDHHNHYRHAYIYNALMHVNFFSKTQMQYSRSQDRPWATAMRPYIRLL